MRDGHAEVRLRPGHQLVRLPGHQRLPHHQERLVRAHEVPSGVQKVGGRQPGSHVQGRRTPECELQGEMFCFFV